MTSSTQIMSVNGWDVSYSVYQSTAQSKWTVEVTAANKGDQTVAGFKDLETGYDSKEDATAAVRAWALKSLP